MFKLLSFVPFEEDPGVGLGTKALYVCTGVVVAGSAVFVAATVSACRAITRALEAVNPD